MFGPDRKFPQYSGENVKSFFTHTGIKYEWNDDPLPPIWEKYIFIAAFGLVTALTGKSLGEVMENAEHRKTVEGIMAEICAIAGKKAIKLPSDIIQKSINKAHNFPHEAWTSYQRDTENKVQCNEGDLYGGTIIREGNDMGVTTPITQSTYKKITDLYGKR
jgi:2-dehydropantoate 2-reductase